MKLKLDDLIAKEKKQSILLAHKDIYKTRCRVKASLFVETDIVNGYVCFRIEDYLNDLTIYKDRISLAIEAYNDIGVDDE